ncbi:MAG: hypothetical protein KC457_22455 [Myxococcales bacterium]|nr:hypothetical protein [Myxococcales bacterium]
MRRAVRLSCLLLCLSACPDLEDPGNDDVDPSTTDETTTTSDEESTSTSTTDTSTEESTTANFITTDDTGDPAMQCEPILQNCPEGEKCVWAVPEGGYQRREGAICIPITGDIQPFEPCSLPTGFGQQISDDCGPESYCLEVYQTADHGFCMPFADGKGPDDVNCDAYPGTVYVTENGSSFPDACMFHECNPLMLAETCPADMTCVFYPAQLYATNLCLHVPPDFNLSVGAACDFGDCGKGKLCAPTEWLPDCADERCCTEWCDLNNPSCATPGTECVFFPTWGEFDNPDYQNLGACVLPGTFD